MISLQILDIKSFMSELLVKNVFDSFCLTEFELSTQNTFRISAYINEAFFTEEELEVFQGRKYSLWNEIKPFAYQLIKGNKTPLSFKIIFILAPNEVSKFLKESNITFNHEDIQGLFINLKYESNKLTCITGTSLSFFTMDKTIENEWDGYVKRFFKDNLIAFE